MYKIPENFNINSLSNIVISQIAFGLNSITLYHNKGFIQFSGGFSIRFGDQIIHHNEVYPVQDDFGLLKLLLEKAVTDVQTNEERNSLILEFENKITLVLIGNDQYESFTLNHNGREIIV